MKADERERFNDLIKSSKQLYDETDGCRTLDVNVGEHIITGVKVKVSCEHGHIFGSGVFDSTREELLDTLKSEVYHQAVRNN